MHVRHCVLCYIANCKYCINACFVYTYIAMQVYIGVCIMENQGKEAKELGQHNTTLLYSVQLNCTFLMTIILKSSL